MKNKYFLLAICLTAIASGIPKNVLGAVVAKNNFRSTRIDKNNFNILVTQNSNDAEYFFNQGNAYYQLKDYQAAIADYTKAIEINPNITEPYIYRGSLYSKLNEYQAAIADYTKVIEINPNDAEAYFNRGIAYYDLKDYQAAITNTRKAAQIFKQQGNIENYQRMQQALEYLERR
jgi:tetratricopeptide (TPR) repeat protein